METAGLCILKHKLMCVEALELSQTGITCFLLLQRQLSVQIHFAFHKSNSLHI